MNNLVTMAQAARLFGFTGSAHVVCKKARRRLQAIADNDPEFVFFKPAGSREWHTTIQDLRRVIPELFRHDPDLGAEPLGDHEGLSERVSNLTMRVSRVERALFVQQQAHGLRA